MTKRLRPGIAAVCLSMLLFVLGGSPIARASGRESAKPCGGWKNDVSQLTQGKDTLAAIGVVSADSDQPLVTARERALEAITQQIRVSITSSHKTESSETYANGHAQDSQHIENVGTATSQFTLEGAETLDSCQADGQVYVAVGIGRALFVQRTTEQVLRTSATISKLQNDAQAAADGHRFIDAAAAFRQAATLARAADDSALAIRVVGKKAFAATWPDATELDRKAQAILSNASVSLKVVPAENTALLRQLAVSCLSYAGLPISENADTGDTVIKLDVALDPPMEALPGLFVVRAQMSGSLRRPTGETASAASDAAVKGGGATAANATADAIRRLGRDKLNALLDALLKDAKWDAKSCVDRH